MPHCSIIGVSIAAGMTLCTRQGNGRSPSGSTVGLLPQLPLDALGRLRNAALEPL